MKATPRNFLFTHRNEQIHGPVIDIQTKYKHVQLLTAAKGTENVCRLWTEHNWHRAVSIVTKVGTYFCEPHINSAGHSKQADPGRVQTYENKYSEFLNKKKPK